MVINADDETYDVLFYDFKHGGNAQNPTNKTQHPHVVNPGQTNQVQGSRIRPRGDFGASLPFGTYKYDPHTCPGIEHRPARAGSGARSSRADNHQIKPAVVFPFDIPISPVKEIE